MAKPTVTRQNPYPGLSDFSAQLESIDTETGLATIKFNLVIGEMDISDTDGHVWRVALHTAHVKLHSTGADIDPVGKWGEEIKGPIVKRSTKISESELTRQYKAGGNLKVAANEISGSLDAGGAIEGKTTEKESAEAVVEKVVNRVVAKPGNTWQINSEAEDFLSGTYIADQVLCKIRMSHGANRSAIGAYLIARQRDLKVDLVDDGPLDIAARLKNFGGKSKKRILDILVAKGLTDSAANETLADFGGSAVLSALEIAFDSDEGLNNG